MKRLSSNLTECKREGDNGDRKRDKNGIDEDGAKAWVGLFAAPFAEVDSE